MTDNDQKNPEQSQTAQNDEHQMKECFGVNFGWLMEDMPGDYRERERCYRCPDFDHCFKLSLMRSMTQTRLEIRRAAKTIGNAFGGSHSQQPF